MTQLNNQEKKKEIIFIFRPWDKMSIDSCKRSHKRSMLHFIVALAHIVFSIPVQRSVRMDFFAINSRFYEVQSDNGNARLQLIGSIVEYATFFFVNFNCKVDKCDSTTSARTLNLWNGETDRFVVFHFCCRCRFAYTLYIIHIYMFLHLHRRKKCIHTWLMN